MNCSEVQELLSAYFDGELADDTYSQVSAHLQECSGCAKQLATFQDLSVLANSMKVPTPPSHIWSQLEKQLDQPSKTAQAAQGRWRPRLTRKRLALAASLLIAVGVTWFSYARWLAPGGNEPDISQHRAHGHLVTEFAPYLKKFQEDPNAAQQYLIEKYDGEVLVSERAFQQVGYRPAVLESGLPDGYTVKSTYVVKMPCCTCVQTICVREDGSALAIFEHDDGKTTKWFGDRPESKETCQGKQCSMVDLDSQIAATWQRGDRHITLIGVRDAAEVEQLVAWLDEGGTPSQG